MRVQGAKKNPKLTDVSPETVTVNLPKQTIHNVFLIDASGSMSGQKYDNAIKGVNALLKSIKEDTDTINTVTIVEFEGRRIVHTLPLTTDIPSKYYGMGTDGMTPLNQAVGESIVYIRDERKSKFTPTDKVLVNVFTDGGENSSSGTYKNPKVLAQLIKDVQADGFTVTFVGTQDEVNYAITTLSVDASNTMVHNNSAADITRSFNATILSRQSYSKSVAKGEDVTTSFYSKSVKK